MTNYLGTNTREITIAKVNGDKPARMEIMKGRPMVD
jgi:hypothetical protein